MKVHCRIGSLENYGELMKKDGRVHCRIGSLENQRQPEGEW